MTAASTNAAAMLTGKSSERAPHNIGRKGLQWRFVTGIERTT